MVQTWLLSSQLEQAVGRARLLREDCRVFVYAGFPVEQAKYIDRLCVQKNRINRKNPTWDCAGKNNGAMA